MDRCCNNCKYFVKASEQTAMCYAIPNYDVELDIIDFGNATMLSGTYCRFKPGLLQSVENLLDEKGDEI